MSDVYKKVLGATGESDSGQVAKAGRWAVGEISRLSCEGERKDAVIEAADRLYKQLHNIREARPRWANESVCIAMVELGKKLEIVSEGLAPERQVDGGLLCEQPLVNVLTSEEFSDATWDPIDATSEERSLIDTVKGRIADPKIVDIDLEDLCEKQLSGVKNDDTERKP